MKLKKGKYSQDLRIFIIRCPAGGKIVRTVLRRLNQVADDYDTLEQSHDALLAACEAMVECLGQSQCSKCPIDCDDNTNKPRKLGREAIAQAKENK